MAKKKKPVATCRLLFHRDPSVRGWGTVDDDKVHDFGDSSWEPTPEFQAASRQPPALPPARPIPPGLANPPPRRPSSHRRPPFCTLVFLVPKRLEYVTCKECRGLWSHCNESYAGSGKVKASVRERDEVTRALEMRSAMGFRVLVKECPDFFAECETMEMIGTKVRNHVKYMNWTNPLHAWALLTSNGSNYEVDVDVGLWFPPPSFRVHCETPDGLEITNYGEITKAFTHGMQLAFPKWEVNPNGGDIEIVLEIDNYAERCYNMSVLIELKPCSVTSPFTEPFHPLNDTAVAHNLLRMVELKPGDVILNCTCSAVDVVEEALQSYPDLMHTIVCDADLSTVVDSVNQAGKWDNARHADGGLCALSQLPFRDSSVDVVIGMLHVPATCRDVRQALSDQLQEMARICRLNTGRVCILTEYKDEVTSLLAKRVNWSSVQPTSTSFGQFSCMLYVLRRSASEFLPKPPPPGCHSPPGSQNHNRGRRRKTRFHPVGIPPGMGQSGNTACTTMHPYDRGVPYNYPEEDDMDWTESV